MVEVPQLFQDPSAESYSSVSVPLVHAKCLFEQHRFQECEDYLHSIRRINASGSEKEPLANELIFLKYYAKMLRVQKQRLEWSFIGQGEDQPLIPSEPAIPSGNHWGFWTLVNLMMCVESVLLKSTKRARDGERRLFTEILQEMQLHEGSTLDSYLLYLYLPILLLLPSFKSILFLDADRY